MNKIKRSELPTALSALGGGYFVDVMNIHGQPHALIVAPREDGETEL